MIEPLLDVRDLKVHFAKPAMRFFVYRQQPLAVRCFRGKIYSLSVKANFDRCGVTFK